MTIPAGLHLTPVEPLTPDEQEFQAWKAAQQTPDEAEFQAWKAKQGLPTGPAVAPDVSRALARNRANPTGDWEATKTSLAANYLNALQVIPGMERAQAYLGSKLNDMPYETYLEGQRKETNAIPAPIRIGEQVATGALLGGVPAVAKVAGALSPAAAGAVLGGATQALSADPMDPGLKGVAERGLRAGVGAVGGALLGKGMQKLTDLVGTGTQSVLQRNPDAAVGVELRPTAISQNLKMQAERAASAKALYAAADAEGKANAVTPAIQQFLAEEDIAPIVAKIQSGRTGSQLDTPGLLDRVFKELSAQQKSALKGLAVNDPTNPSGLISKLADVRGAKAQALSSMAGAGQTGPAYMPSYPAAVEDYATRSGDIKALTKGYEALRNASPSQLPAMTTALRKGPEVFKEWLQTANPSELDAARQGILGGVRQSYSLPGKTFGPAREAITDASKLLRMFPGSNAEFVATLQKLGLIGANAALPSGVR